MTRSRTAASTENAASTTKPEVKPTTATAKATKVRAATKATTKKIPAKTKAKSGKSKVKVKDEDEDDDDDEDEAEEPEQQNEEVQIIDDDDDDDEPKVIEADGDDDDNDVEFVYYLSEKEMREINKAFDLNCSNEEEELDSNNLKTAIRSLGFEPRVDEIRKLFKKYSSKKSRKVNRNGFHKIMTFKMGSAPGTRDNCPKDEISRVFNLLDLDKKGFITVDNLKSIAKELNEDITEEELLEMITEADTDGDLKVDKQDFQTIMKKTSLY